MMSLRTIGCLICCSALFTACGGGGGGSNASAPASAAPAAPVVPAPVVPVSPQDPQLSRTVVMSGLNAPWDLAFTPDGTMLFTERCRGLSARQMDGTVRRLFGTTGSAVVAADLWCQGQSGMHGVAIDPDFANNRFVYVYMASTVSPAKSNRVVRLNIDSNYSTVGSRTDIISDIPFKTSDNAWGGAGSHSGGRIRFSASDGFLYVTTGDNHNGTLPQDLTRLGGKILRVDRNGAAAAGNNTPAGGDARIFTYGHRNVQGIAFRPGTAAPFSCEHGPGHDDEVTALLAGGNGGWDPKPESGVSCADNYCGLTCSPWTRTGLRLRIRRSQACPPRGCVQLCKVRTARFTSSPMAATSGS
jgi:aldose sugar dehydrogenase